MPNADQEPERFTVEDETTGETQEDVTEAGLERALAQCTESDPDDTAGGQRSHREATVRGCGMPIALDVRVDDRGRVEVVEHGTGRDLGHYDSVGKMIVKLLPTVRSWASDRNANRAGDPGGER